MKRAGRMRGQHVWRRKRGLGSQSASVLLVLVFTFYLIAWGCARSDNSSSRAKLANPEQSQMQLGPQRDPRYMQLQAGLQKYQVLAQVGGWPQLKPQPSAAELAKRLLIEGDLKVVEPSYEQLEQAILNFQLRQTLEPDGVVGPKTLRALNVSAKERVEQIEINLQRWHRLPQILPSEYAEVNIPAYTLSIFSHSKLALSMKTIVGAKKTPTPTLSSQITATVVNPNWDVPHSIASKELLPLLQQDASYLAKNHFVVMDRNMNLLSSAPDWNSLSKKHFPYHLRQTPGDWNSVGPIKFIFPNQHHVYLHGTPAKHLFNSHCRCFSHGCIRVEDPVQFAQWLMTRNEADMTGFEAALASGKTKTFNLSSPLPIYLNYWTAWADDRGSIYFADDVYGWDSQLADAIR